MNEFNAYLVDNNIDICFGNETHLDDEIAYNMISVYHTIHRTDMNKFGVAVMICVNNKFKSVKLNYDNEKLEFEIVPAFINNEKYIFTTIYVKPNPSLNIVEELGKFF